MKTGKIVMVSVLALLIFGACQQKAKKNINTKSSEKLSVYTVNYPLYYFAQRIGGGWVDVRFPAPANVDPAYWNPDAETILAYQQADIILRNGASYAKWIDKVTLPASKLYNTSSSIPQSLIIIEGETTHSHGAEGKHAHGKQAFTTWLNPKLAISQAEAILQVFAQKMPEHAANFEEQFQKLKKDLLALDAEIAKVVAKNPNKPVLFSHPVYQYFEKRYSINGQSLHWDTDEYPTANMWHDFEHLQEHQAAKVMIWEGKPGKEVVEELNKHGITSIVFKPCGNAPDSGDYMMVMKVNLENLELGYGK